MLTDELSLLGLYGLLLIAIIVVQVLIALPNVGLPYLSTPRDEGRDTGTLGGRAQRALDNSVVAMALFAPAILILAVKGISTPTTVLSAQVFVVARLAYVPVYIAGIPWLRTLVWTAGVVAVLTLYLVGFGSVTAPA
ncbi:MAG: MAPEG family protein [Pseudomonadota bacterium]